MQAQRRDRGSGPVTVLLVLGILALVGTLTISAVLSVAADESANAQHAADAAALAGAQGVLDDLPATLGAGFTGPDDIAEVIGGGTCLQTGRVDAAQLAAANGAALTSYCWNVFRDTVSVGVQLDRTTVAQSPDRADAEAATTFDASDCRFPGGFTRPTQPAAEGGDAEEAPPPPPAVDTTVDCGFGPLAVRLGSGATLFRFVGLEAALEDLRPRLTG